MFLLCEHLIKIKARIIIFISSVTVSVMRRTHLSVAAPSVRIQGQFLPPRNSLAKTAHSHRCFYYSLPRTTISFLSDVLLPSV